MKCHKRFIALRSRRIIGKSPLEKIYRWLAANGVYGLPGEGFYLVVAFERHMLMVEQAWHLQSSALYNDLHPFYISIALRLYYCVILVV
ncbi:MAG: hypothetical protein AB1345_13155 [Chloroflexota bacterium]